MKNVIKIFLVIAIFSNSLFAQRIKDIAVIGDINSQQVIGYGLVVGLAGTGDSHRSSFTIQSITSMLKRFGITIPQDELKTRNVAAVMVTSTINGLQKPNSQFDVNVSSIGDAKSLQGGILLMTPLSGLDGNVYAIAQGPISVGGYDITTKSGNRVAKNHTLAGRVPRGGILKQSPVIEEPITNEVKVYLKEPDLTTSDNIAKAINAKFGNEIAKSLDASQVNISVPVESQQKMVDFLAQLESLEVQSDYPAKVVLNERTGTVVAGNTVKIKPVTISHGGYNISIKSNPIISQPGAFSQGRLAIFNNLIPQVTEDSTNVVALQGASNVQEVASALNSLKVTPQDIIAIFQAIKEAGALVGELIIL